MLMQKAMHQEIPRAGEMNAPSQPLLKARTANVRNFHSTHLMGITQSAPTQAGSPRVGAKR
jgi:hypothetical protein